VPLVPELSLYQAAEVTPLWQATAASLEEWDPAPFWAFPWAGGQALARHLLDHPELVAGRSVLDFATGSGLVALAALRAGAARVLACDVDPYCEAAVEANAALNGLAVEFTLRDGTSLRGGDFAVVLAGDVFYEAPLAAAALAWLGAAATAGSLVLAGDGSRTYAPRDGVTERAAYVLPPAPAIEADGPVHARVLQVLPAAAR
jgi:predicted nicotinamide N-methyase